MHRRSKSLQVDIVCLCECCHPRFWKDPVVIGARVGSFAGWSVTGEEGGQVSFERALSMGVVDSRIVESDVVVALFQPKKALDRYCTD